MLPLLSDRVRIALTPETVSATRISRLFRREVTEKHTVPCAPASAPADWQAALAGLTDLLSRMKRERADGTVILSNRFVRYALLPWSENLRHPHEQMAYARHRFASIHGEEAENWEIRLSPGGTGEPRVASAVDPAMLQSLRDRFKGTRLRLNSIQPYLMAAYNLWRPTLNGGDCLFLAVENRRYACAALRGGRWSAVRGGVYHGELADELPVILDRERVWGDFSDRPPVFVHAPEQPGFAPPAGQAWNVKPLRLPARRGFSPISDSGYGMAMTAD